MKKLVLFAALLCPVVASAEFFDGNRLLSIMQGSNTERLQALGYVTGVTDALMGSVTCPPTNVTAGQISDMTLQMLLKLPEERHKSADQFVRAAVEGRWPCKKKNSSSRDV